MKWEKKITWHIKLQKFYSSTGTNVSRENQSVSFIKVSFSWRPLRTDRSNDHAHFLSLPHSRDFSGPFCHGAASPAAPRPQPVRHPHPGARRGCCRAPGAASAPAPRLGPDPAAGGTPQPMGTAPPVTGPGRVPPEPLKPPAAQPLQNGSHCHAGAGRPPRARDNRAPSVRTARRGDRGTTDAMPPTPPVPVPTIVPGTVRSLRPGPAPHNDCAPQQTGKGRARRAAAAPALPRGAGPRAARAVPCRPGGPSSAVVISQGCITEKGVLNRKQSMDLIFSKVTIYVYVIGL